MSNKLVAYFSATGVTKKLAEKLFLFATSDSGSIGKTAEKRMPFLSDGAEIVDAKVMNDDPSEAQLKAWARC